MTRTSPWAAECEACRWVDGATAAGVGARFRGDNRVGDRTWSTVSVVDEAVPDRRFSFNTEGDGEPITRGNSTFRADGDANVFTEGSEHVALPDGVERAFETTSSVAACSQRGQHRREPGRCGSGLTRGCRRYLPKS